MAVITKTYRKILAALLAVLGFGGAACNGAPWEMRAEYGTPSATFKVKGTVAYKTSETEYTSIKNINVVLFKKYEYDTEIQYSEIGSTYTLGNGVFNVEGTAFPEKKILYIELTDIDGEENGGLFATDIIEADFSKATFSGGDGHWYNGTASIELKNVIFLKPAQKNETGN